MILAKIEEDAGNLNKSIDAYKLSYTYQDSLRDKVVLKPWRRLWLNMIMKNWRTRKM